MPSNSAFKNGYKPISAVKLLAADLPEVQYIVADLMTEGLGIVAGAPKVGKSWLTLQAAVEISIGGSVLGRSCEQRDVLYYALEDGERRIQKRLRKLDAGRDESKRLRLLFEAPRLGEGLEEQIEAWLAKHEGGVVVIDILAKVRPNTSRGNAYQEDYEVMAPLHELARSHPGSVLIGNTHDRKAAADDILTTVTGTRGITGSADWIWVVKRPRLDPVGEIHIVGRDIEQDLKLSARFDGTWTADERPLPVASPERNRIYDWLVVHGPAYPKNVAIGLGITPNAAQRLLVKMHQDGQLQKTPEGYDIDRSKRNPNGTWLSVEV